MLATPEKEATAYEWAEMGKRQTGNTLPTKWFLLVLAGQIARVSPKGEQKGPETAFLPNPSSSPTYFPAVETKEKRGLPCFICKMLSIPFSLVEVRELKHVVMSQLFYLQLWDFPGMCGPGSERVHHPKVRWPIHLDIPEASIPFEWTRHGFLTSLQSFQNLEFLCNQAVSQ